MDLNIILSKTDLNKESGCMIWKGALNSEGYGRITYNGNPNFKVHRLVLYLSGVDIFDKVVRHKCDVRACINPEHLITGTAYDNVKDMDERGRRFRTINKDICLRVYCFLSLGFTSKQISDLMKIDTRRISEIRLGQRTIDGKLAKARGG